MSIPQLPQRRSCRGTLGTVELAAYLKITRPTLGKAKREGRLVVSDGAIVYTPAPRGKPRKDQR